MLSVAGAVVLGEFYGLLKITDDEKKSLIDDLAQDRRDIGGLYTIEIPVSGNNTIPSVSHHW